VVYWGGDSAVFMLNTGSKSKTQTKRNGNGNENRNENRIRIIIRTPNRTEPNEIINRNQLYQLSSIKCMKKFQNKYRIPSARAQWWNYDDDGAYFITICTAHMKCFFGTITGQRSDPVVVLSELGEIVQKYWLEIPEHFPYIKLDTFQVMPNHFHGIIIIDKSANQNNLVETPNVETPNVVETPNLGVSTDTDMDTDTETKTPTPTSPESPKCGGKNDRWHKGVLGVVINQYKRKCTIECRNINSNFGWQPRFYDNIIRDQESYDRISAYIINNPAKWKDDKFHPSKPDTEK